VLEQLNGRYDAEQEQATEQTYRHRRRPRSPRCRALLARRPQFSAPWL